MCFFLSFSWLSAVGEVKYHRRQPRSERSDLCACDEVQPVPPSLHPSVSVPCPEEADISKLKSKAKIHF